jgi:hypothetical protein
MYCTGLTELPAGLLPATTLQQACYTSMFQNCTGLTKIYMMLDWFSKTPAQSGMFNGCTSITENTSYLNIPSGWK